MRRPMFTAVMAAIAVSVAAGDLQPLFGKNPRPRTYPLSEMTFTDLAAFNTAAGRPPMAISFDNIPANSDISNSTICGVRFESDHAPLIVVQADQTTTPDGFEAGPEARDLRLHATSGAQLLSPGGCVLAPGPLPAVEDDDILLRFNPPVAAVGFDISPQLCDGMSLVRVEVWTSDMQLLYVGELPIPGSTEQRHFGDAPILADDTLTTGFWGVVSDSCNIGVIYLDEYDDNNSPADSNIGIDSIRFAPVPEACLRGDMTGDDRVDSADALILMAMMGECPSGTIPNVRWCEFDLNRDGTVDIADLLALLGSMQRSSSVTAP